MRSDHDIDNVISKIQCSTGIFYRLHSGAALRKPVFLIQSVPFFHTDADEFRQKSSDLEIGVPTLVVRHGPGSDDLG